MGCVLTVEPTVEPVTVADAMAHCRAAGQAEETYFSVLITAARRLVETKAKKDFINRTWRMDMEQFPLCREIYVPHPPLSSVTHIKYYDTSNTLQTLNSSTYLVNTSSVVGEIELVAGQVWPAVYPERYNAVQVTFVSGYGATAATVPATFRQAILLLVGHFYEHREAVSELQTYKLPMAVDALISADARIGVY